MNWPNGSLVACLGEGGRVGGRARAQKFRSFSLLCYAKAARTRRRPPRARGTNEAVHPCFSSVCTIVLFFPYPISSPPPVFSAAAEQLSQSSVPLFSLSILPPPRSSRCLRPFGRCWHFHRSRRQRGEGRSRTLLLIDARAVPFSHEMRTLKLCSLPPAAMPAMQEWRMRITTNVYSLEGRVKRVRIPSEDLR